MKTKAFTLPELMFLAGTRAALGAGIGLLLSPRLSRGARKALGLALVSVGALATIPIVTTGLKKPYLVKAHRAAA